MLVSRRILGPLCASFQKWKYALISQQNKKETVRIAEKIMLKWSNMALNRAFLMFYYGTLDVRGVCVCVLVCMIVCVYVCMCVCVCVCVCV